MKNKILTIIFLSFMSLSAIAQIGVNTQEPHQSAILDVYATDKGLLIPRVALTGVEDVNTIPNPQVSLMVYNTVESTNLNKSFYYWSGTKWKQLGDGSYTYINGLKNVENKIGLGGELVENTEIVIGDYNMTVKITGTGSFNVINGSTKLFNVQDNGNIGIGLKEEEAGAKLDVIGNVKITDGTEALHKVLISDATGVAIWNFIGSETVLDNSLTATDIAPETLTSAEIADNAITNTELAANSVSTTEIIDGTIEVTDIKNPLVNQVLTSDDGTNVIWVNKSTLTNSLGLENGKLLIGNMGDNAQAHFLTGDITLSNTGDVQIKTDAITGTEIANGSVTTNEITNETILAEDIAGNTLDHVLTTNSSGDVVWVNKSALSSSIVIPEAELLIGDGLGIAKSHPVSGDITMTNAGDMQIKADVITSTEIANNAVTTTEIATNAVTTNEIATSAVTSVNIATDAVTTTKIATSAVTTNEIANGTIKLEDLQQPVNADNVLTSDGTGTVRWIDKSELTSSIVIADARVLIGNAGSAQERTISGDVTLSNLGEITIINDAVTTNKIKTDAVTSNEIATDAVTSSEIITDAVDSDEIKKDAVKEDEIATGAVTTNEIKDKTILVADINPGANDQVLGTTASGDVAWINKSALSNELGVTDGSILIGNSSNKAVSRSLGGEISMTNTGVVTINNNAVTTAKILNSNVTTDKIADLNVTTAKIANSSISTGKIQTGAITSNEILDNTINSADIANETITTADIAKPGSNKVLITDGSDNVVWADKSDITDYLSLGNTKILVGGVDGQVHEQTIGGDATITNTGQLTVANNAITEGKIDNNAITSNKINNDAVTNSKIATDAVRADEIQADAVGTSEIATNAVGTVEIQDNAIITSKITDGAVVTSKIADNNITTGKIQDNAIVENKIQAGAVTTFKIGNDAVTSVKIIDDAVTSPKIADNAVTSLKIAGDAVTSTKILDGTIISADIATSAVTTTEILDGTIVVADINDNAIISSKILNGTIQTDDIKTGGANKMLTTNASNIVEWVDKTDHIYTAGTGINIDASNNITNTHTLSIVGDQLTLTNANTITVPTGADDLGDHVLDQNLNLGTNYITNDGTSRGIKINNGGDLQLTHNMKLPSSSSTAGKILFVDVSSTSEIAMFPDKSNIGIGKQTIEKLSDPNNSGSNNVALGNKALNKITDASNCIAIGNEALFSNISGTSCFAIGANALHNTEGENNVGIGTGTGITVISGTQNTFIGNYADITGASNYSNATAIGYSAKVNASNKITLGNTSVNVVQFAGYNTQDAGSYMIMDGAGNISTKTETDANRNTVYGFGASTQGGVSNSMALGFGALVDVNNKIVLGNGSVTSVQFPGYSAGVLSTDGAGNITSSPNISLTSVICTAEIRADHFVATMGGTAGSYKYNTSINMNVPDYVFETYYLGKSDANPEYKISSLQEVETFLEKNKHLPRVPSRAYILKEGAINIQGMQMVTLEKVEELFIYTIEQDKQLNEQEKQLNEQETQIQELRKEMELIKEMINN